MKFLILFLMGAVLYKNQAWAGAFTGGGIFSVDFGYMETALRNNGWGLGIAYEYPILNCASVRGHFAHVSLKPDATHDWITTVGIGLDARIYPFNMGLNRLYVGYGIQTDFLMFLQKEGKQNEVYISHCPQVGWKENFLDYVMVEAYCGYRMNITDVNSFAMESGIVKHGFEYGLGVKLNLKKIGKLLFGKTEE